jgi:hypothetical protein
MRLLIWLLLLGAFQLNSFAQASGAARQGQRSYVAWWQKPAMQQTLDLADQDWHEIQSYFERMVIEYNAKRSELVVSKQELLARYSQSDQTNEAIDDFFKEYVAKFEAEIQEMRFSFRMHLRKQLSKQTLDRLAAEHPKFFTSRWIPVTKTPIRKVTPQ